MRGWDGPSPGGAAGIWVAVAAFPASTKLNHLVRGMPGKMHHSRSCALDLWFEQQMPLVPKSLCVSETRFCFMDENSGG